MPPLFKGGESFGGRSQRLALWTRPEFGREPGIDRPEMTFYYFIFDPHRTLLPGGWPLQKHMINEMKTAEEHVQAHVRTCLYK